jgi:hypothetical protein
MIHMYVGQSSRAANVSGVEAASGSISRAGVQFAERPPFPSCDIRFVKFLYLEARAIFAFFGFSLTTGRVNHAGSVLYCS